jgi:hypothetical protein
MQGTGNSPHNIGLKLIVGHGLAGYELCTSIGELYDHRRFDTCSGFQRSIDAAVTNGVNGWQGELMLFGILIEGSKGIAV